MVEQGGGLDAPTTSRGTSSRPTVAEARRIVEQNASVASALGLRETATVNPRFLQTLREAGFTYPSELTVTNRNSKIEPLLDNLKARAKGYDAARVIADLARRYGYARSAEIGGLSLGDRPADIRARAELRDIPRIPFSQDFYTDPADPIPYVFQEIFNPKDRAVSPELSREWMRVLDDYVDRSSERNLAAIDEAGRQVVKKKLVIVGGGLLTSLAVSVLGQYYDVTVVTKDGRLAQNWRNRPIFINSSVENKFGPNLPLLSGTTTPVIAQGQLNYIDPAILLGGDTLRVRCDDGSTREYVSGLELGKVAATNTVFGAEDFITGQEVDFRRSQINSDGSTRLTLVDATTGKRRTLDAEIVISLTGPGEEVVKLKDKQSERDYNEARQQVKSQIARARKRVAGYKEKLARLDRRSTDPKVLKQIASLEREIMSRNNSTRIKLPGILSLTIVEDLYDFWQNDQASDPNSFPLQELFKRGKRVAIAGGGDTARTLTELLSGKGPRAAYPGGIRPTETPQIVIFGLNGENRQRQRYTDSLRGNIFPADIKVTGAYLDKGRPIVQYQIAGEPNTTSDWNNVFVSTGLGGEKVADLLPRGFDVGNIQDLDGNVVGKGSRRNSFYIGGSATGFKRDDFPPQIRNIITGLGIPENTVSAWVNAVLLERLLWTVLDERGPDVEKLRRLSPARAQVSLAR